MAALLRTLELENGTDARFRAWGSAIGVQLAAGGWVQTADTGQINWLTVLAPAAINTYQGYEIWRSNDAVGSLLELYVRIYYGSGSISAVTPQILVQVGFGTDGAGNFTNNHFVSITAGMSSAGATGLVNCILSAGAGWFVFALGSTASKTILFTMERTRNASYLFQNEVFLMTNLANIYYSRIFTPLQVYNRVDGTVAHTLPLATTQTMFNGTIHLGMYVGWKGYVTNPMINLYGFNTGMLGVNYGKVDVMGYNQNHTYMIAPNVADSCFNANASFQHLIRFE